MKLDQLHPFKIRTENYSLLGCLCVCRQE